MNNQAAREAFATGLLDPVCEALAAMYPDDPEIHRFPEFVQFALVGGECPKNVLPETAVFLESISRIVIGSTSTGHISRHFLPQELDFIADLDGIGGWSAIQSLNRIALDNIEPSRRCAVVGTMRDDGIYILEWVAHYLALGFEHVFIYTNDNADSSGALFNLLADHGIITLIESEITGAVPPEAKAFGHALHLLTELRNYEWALFVDSDEFFVPAAEYDHSILSVLHAFERQFPDGRVAGICYDWLWFVSDMIFERKPGLLCERFQHARPHWLSKSFVRLKDVQSMRQQHYPELYADMSIVDSAFKPINLSTIWERKQAEYRGGRINHYWPRSFQEFAIKKARGASLGAENKLYDRPYAQFFSWNGYSTKENHFPEDAKFILKKKETMARLRLLSGVTDAADRIEREFPAFLARIVDREKLFQAYSRNAREPGTL